MADILDDNKLRFLPTKKIYDQLNKGTDGCQDEEFYKAAKTKLGEYNWFQDVSGKILNGLCYVYRNNFTGEYDNDICEFLYYWLADILYDNIIPRFFFYHIMPYLFGILRIRNEKKCTAPNYYYINEDKYFKKIKLFFDYSKDYDIYKDQLDTKKPPLCKEEYKKYLETYVDTYNTFQSECQDKPTSGYCEAFNKYFNEKEHENLSKWTCILQNNEQRAEKIGEQLEKEQQLSPGPVMGVYPATMQNEVSSIGREEEKSHGSSDIPSRQTTPEFTSIPHSSDVSSISRTTKTIATTASVAGILVPPFLVYNFTPVRSWINKLLGRNHIYRNPLTESELIENSYQPHHFDSERNGYNISYRPE